MLFWFISWCFKAIFMNGWRFVVVSGVALDLLAWAALLSVNHDCKESSADMQQWWLYITNISSWRLLISQVSIGALCRGDQSSTANQWGHFFLLERLVFDPCHRLVGLHPRRWGFFSLFCVMNRSGRRVMNTLVLAARWAPRGCTRHMCEDPVVFPPHCQMNPQILLRGLI